MSLPNLAYKPTTQNQRVLGFGPSDQNEEAIQIYRLEKTATAGDFDQVIWAAYRHVFNEQEVLKFNRLVTLETQLRNRAISVRDFIRGLAKSERFYRLVVSTNNNYRLVEVALKRLLGRVPYSKDEEIALSIQIATAGWHGFVDRLLDSDEYIQAFGDDTVPYQRKRMKDQPFSFTPRYGEDYRDKLPQAKVYNQFEPFDWETFRRSANWPVVAGLLLLLIGICSVALGISYGLKP